VISSVGEFVKDEWTCGEIVRHLTGAEKFFVTKIVDDRFTADLDLGPAEDWDATRRRFDEIHHAWLALAGTEAPQIHGYRMEDVVAKVGARP